MQNQPLYSGWFLYIFGEMLKSRLFFSFAFVLSLLVVSGCSSDVEYGELVDSRDGQVYKTVVIGGQTWMAEDLDYADSINYPSMLERNWCYTLYSTPNRCEGHGRLYTWAAAMDSMGTFSNNGKGCGDGWTCSPTYPVRGICPEGWHLPDTTEWKNLFLDVGGKSIAGKMLKTVSGWENDGNGTDEYGFSAWPSGKRENVYSGSFSGRWETVIFWTSTSNRQVSRGNGLCTWFSYKADSAYMDLCVKHYGYSVRCVKDR
ncbi:MAG: fibrobacter succinogenes major paralogous domain-containing protein [Fibrobacter sp.]|nr:fibrobacter succinogenes major paralogous domain-containing protein [Fibrobacter sp.]